MAERRRIIPASVGPLFNPKEEKSWTPAVRFTLTLDEPNDTKCTEISYRELYKTAVGGTDDDKNFNDLDEEDMSGLAAFAKKFEEKYAAKGGKKKRRERFDDLMDVGMGYDENDPFVDNSECYDELVPSVLTTQLGGFYINQGKLNFREISDSEGDDDFIHVAKSRKKKTPGKKKRKSSFEEKERKRRKQEKKEKKAKKQLQKQFGSKKKKLSGSPTVAELLKRQKPAGKTSTSIGDFVNGTTHNTSKDDLDALDNIDPSLDLGISDFKMDSDMAAIMDEALADMGESDALGGSEDSIGNGSILEQVDDVEQYVKLPEGIPSDLVAYVHKIKDAAKKSVEGKCKFFTPSVNQLLLKIELKSRDLSCGTRSQMYSHLASHLPCGKETLLKRAKKLRLGATDVNIKEPLQKLREAIAKVMPDNIKRYHEECQTHAIERANRQMEGKEEGKISDDEEDKKSKQGNYGPRKKFQWTDEIRKLLCDVVSVKVKTYEVMKSRSMSAEDFFRSFLDLEVKPLWPQGWIQTRMLYKETRGVHGHLTMGIKQPKKVVLATKKQGIKKPDVTPPSQSPSQSSMSVASMIRQAIMSPNGASNQSTPIQSTPQSEKGTPSTPTLLDYANMRSPNLDSASTSPNTPKSSLPFSSKYNEDSTKNAASLLGNSMSGVSDFTASFMEKIITDELNASSSRTPSQTQSTPNAQQFRQSESNKDKTSPTGQDAMSIADIVAATAKAMETTPVPKERQASSVLKQLSTHAQNNASSSMTPQQQMYAATSTAIISASKPQTFTAKSASKPQTFTATAASKPQTYTATAASKPQTYTATSASKPQTYTATSASHSSISKQQTFAGASTKPHASSIQQAFATASKPHVSVSKPKTFVAATSKPHSVVSKPQTFAAATSKPHSLVSKSQIFAATTEPHVSKPQTYAAAKPQMSKPVVIKTSVVRKQQEFFGSGQDRLKKLNIGDGKRTIMTANAAKQMAALSGSNLSQTIQKLSSTLKGSPSANTSSSVTQSGQSRAVTVTHGVKNINSNSQPVVQLTRPPGVAKVTSAQQAHVVTSKGGIIRMVTQAKPHSQINAKTTTSPVRTDITKQPSRVNVQTLQRTLSSEASQVGHLMSPANVQAGMGNIFANLNEYGSTQSKELPYFAASSTTTSSGKNSHSKTNQFSKTNQSTSPHAYPVHGSSYTTTKVSKQPPTLSPSGSAFTSPSPPKMKPSTPPTLSPSSSPLGQKYPGYVNQRTSPNQTSPKFPTSYTTAMAAVAGYQHMASSGFTQGYPLSANQGQVSAAGGQGDAIITGPAPGTFYHQQAGSGNLLSPMQSPTEQQFQLPSWPQ